jgi:beta-glucosidase
LKIKFESGLMQRGLPSKQGRPLRSQVGSEEHRALARDAVRRSLVLLKNDNQLLPLDPSGHYLVVGKGADNIGMQSGGWTISWQGTGNTNSDFPTGTSLLDGFVEQVAKAGGEVYHNEPVPEGIEVDAVIAVYGESPYAETQGDISSLAWQQPNFEDLALLKQYQKQGFPIVSVFLSGDPYGSTVKLTHRQPLLLLGCREARVPVLLMSYLGRQTGRCNTNFWAACPWHGQVPISTAVIEI